MATRRPSSKNNGSIGQETVRALLARKPALRRAVEFLLARTEQNLSFQDLRIQPLIGGHCNLIREEPFFLPKERLGGFQDVAMVPLLRTVVDETLRAFAATSPHLLQYVGKTPISPYGSLALSVSRWGYVDWDYIRDLDWRIFLPPEIGHVSGFKSELERTLTRELRKFQLHAVLGGKDEQGVAQVQLRDQRTEEVHGFHFFLIAMKPGFVRGNIHHDGGYSPHFAYFPQGSFDEYLASSDLQWSDMIAQQREDYIAMFSQLSFNIFGESSGEDRLYKTRGWYLNKAFKWYATLARVRGLSSLEEDLMYQYENFRGSAEELSYLARYRYYGRMSPSPQHLDDVDRDLARALSIAYARGRDSEDSLVGKQVSLDGAEIILLERVPERFHAAGSKLFKRAGSSLPDEGKGFAGQLRFADNLAAPSSVQLDKHEQGQAALLPAEWSMVFCDAYVRRVAEKAREESRPIAEDEIRQALAVMLASLLCPGSQVSDGRADAIGSE